MSRTKAITTLVACMLFLTGLSAGAANIYVDIQQDDQGRSAIWRYNQAGNPNHAAGKDGARFVEFTGEPAPGNHFFAYGPDGYLYISTYGSPTIRRANSDAELDSSWSVDLAYPVSPGGDMAFAPDGRLYVIEYYETSHVWLIDIVNKTITDVLNLVNDYAGDIKFDPQGRAYVSSYLRGLVRRYTISGTIWKQDPSFNASVPGASGNTGERAYGLAYNPNDGYLYVNNYTGTVYRFNSSGVRDTTWSAFVDLHPSAPQISAGMDFGPDGALYVAAAHETPPAPSYVARCTTATPPVVTDFLTIPGTQTHVILDVAWDYPLGGSISGNINLQNFSLAKCPVAVRVDLIQGGSVVQTRSVVVDSATGGDYTISNVAPGLYNLVFRAPSWLGATLTNKSVDSGFNTPGCSVSLLNGDPDLDNEVTTTDVSLVLRNESP